MFLSCVVISPHSPGADCGLLWLEGRERKERNRGDERLGDVDVFMSYVVLMLPLTREAVDCELPWVEGGGRDGRR